MNNVCKYMLLHGILFIGENREKIVTNKLNISCNNVIFLFLENNNIIFTNVLKRELVFELIIIRRYKGHINVKIFQVLFY